MLTLTVRVGKSHFPVGSFLNHGVQPWHVNHNSAVFGLAATHFWIRLVKNKISYIKRSVFTP